MVIPAKARSQAGLQTGDIVAVQPDGDGRLILVRLDKPKPAKPVKAKIINRKGRHPVGDLGRPITLEEIKNALSEFP
jgi:AbrB family looped-hinge helix DNA binding protein